MKRGWSEATIGELCQLATGGTPSKAKREYFEGGEIKWLVSGDVHQREIFDCEGRITESGLEHSNARYLPINSVVIALNGQGKTRGTVAMLRTKATCNQSLVSIFPNDISQLLPEFLFHNLAGRYSEIRRLTGDAGNERRGLNMPLIRSIKVPVPPIEEQRRIVAILDEAFEGLARARENAEASRQDAIGLFQRQLDLLFGRLSAASKNRTLDEIAEIKGGKRLPSGKKLLSEITEYPYISVKDFTDDGGVDLAGVRYLDAETRAAIGRYVIRSSDLYISIAGTIGKTGIVPPSLDGANLTENAARLVFKPGISNEYVYFFTRTGYFQNQVGLNTRTSAQPKLALSRLSTISIPVVNEGEQVRIAKELRLLRDQSRDLVYKYRAKASDLDHLRQSLLHKAFSGELT